MISKAQPTTKESSDVLASTLFMLVIMGKEKKKGSCSADGISCKLKARGFGRGLERGFLATFLSLAGRYENAGAEKRVSR